MTNRDFHGEDFYKFCIKEYEEIRQRRKAFKGKPDVYERIEIELDRMFSSTYKKLIG